jgi:hypothetical protein
LPLQRDADKERAERLRLRLHQLFPGMDSAGASGEDDSPRGVEDRAGDGGWRSLRGRRLQQGGSASLTTRDLPSRLLAEPAFAAAALAARFFGAAEPGLSLVRRCSPLSPQPRDWFRCFRWACLLWLPTPCPASSPLPGRRKKPGQQRPRAATDGAGDSVAAAATGAAAWGLGAEWGPPKPPLLLLPQEDALAADQAAKDSSSAAVQAWKWSRWMAGLGGGWRKGGGGGGGCPALVPWGPACGVVQACAVHCAKEQRKQSISLARPRSHSQRAVPEPHSCRATLCPTAAAAVPAACRLMRWRRTSCSWWPGGATSTGLCFVSLTYPF